MSSSADTEELSRFRENWKTEIRDRARTHAHDSTAESPTKAGPSSIKSPAAPSAPSERVQQIVSNLPVFPASDALIYTNSGSSSTRSGILSSAVANYRLAVQFEQRGQLDDALRLYRKAFRSDPNVDRAYHQEQARLAVKTIELAEVDGSLSKTLSDLSLNEGVKHENASKRDSVAKLVSQFPWPLVFEPDVEQEGVFLNILPDEILIAILRWLDVTNIERFAVVSRKARVLSLDSSIWRPLVQVTYVTPQVPVEFDAGIIVRQYLSDYRRLYVAHPRIRQDGVYIAVCHYTRAGLSENPWVNVSQLITYHRYLRFLPNGQVVSLLANEEEDPHAIVPKLNLTLRMKGLLIGTWVLHGTTIHITDLVDPSNASFKYSFQMMLSLKSRPLGRWNRLEITGYYSVETESREAIPFPLKHERPFWFSKVRSYSKE